MARRTYGGSSNPIIPDNAGGAMPDAPKKGPSNKVLAALIGGGVLLVILIGIIITSAGGSNDDSTAEETTVSEEITTVETTVQTAPLYQADDSSYYDYNNTGTSDTYDNGIPDEDQIIVEEEHIYNEDDEAPAETDVADMVYSEDVDDTHSVTPVSPSYTDVTKVAASDPMDTVLDWDTIKGGNKDAMAWIYIPGTSVNYPIMQEPEIGEYYYSSHDYYHNKIISGSIFTPREPEDGLDAHFLILGHNMKNGSMFHTLMNYTEESFCEKSPYVYIYYPDRVEKWQVWTVLYHNVYMDNPIYDTPIEMGSAEHEALINSCIKNTRYKTNAKDPTLEEQILTLSTCNNFDGEHKGRFVVNAVFVDVKPYSNTSSGSNESEPSETASSSAETSAE